MQLKGPIIELFTNPVTQGTDISRSYIALWATQNDASEAGVSIVFPKL